MTPDNRFWSSVEGVETDFLSDCDVVRFRSRMKRKGFDEEVIEERVAAMEDERRHLLTIAPTAPVAHNQKGLQTSPEQETT